MAALQQQQPQDEQERQAGAGASKPSRFRSVVDGFDEADTAASSSSSSAAAATAAPKILAPSRLRGGASLAGADGGAGTLWSEILANRK